VSVFGSRLTNAQTAEQCLPAFKSFTTGEISEGGDLARTVARVHHKVMEVQPSASNKASPAHPQQRPVEKDCEAWQAWLAPTADPQSPQELARQFVEQGLSVLSSGLTAEQVEKSHEEVLTYYDDVMYTLNQLDKQEDLRSGGFTTFKQREEGRYDMQVPHLDDSAAFPWFNEKAPWLPVVRQILGSDCVRLHQACILSLPGSTRQKWHSDGNHLDDAFHLPPHCINVFIPLVDLQSANGPTEFIPTSQLDWATDTPPLILTAKAGQCILFDHRTKHRGLANQTSAARPLVYITYSKPWYVDLNNSSKAGYETLPPVKQRAGRGEKRKAEEDPALEID